ncbi:MAG: argininosuccinate lyase [Nitrospiria bacterium]
MPNKKPSSNKSQWESAAWEGRFSEAADPDAADFTTSFTFDRVLYPYDIQGSIAHTQGLARAGLLSDAEQKILENGLREIEKEMDQETPPFSPDTLDEDVHMHIERRLVEKVGAVGGKLHTGRSRNDQIALDLRLYLRAETGKTIGLINRLQKSLVSRAEAEIDTFLPGYTHLQRAQPISLAHHLLAYYEMLERDASRFKDSIKRLDQMPLGAGALAGNSFSLDRQAAAAALDFSSVTANSLDTVCDRDFAIEFLSTTSTLMMHLSRWSEDWILWATTEFGFLELPDRLSTGSSMMPQKKNPDLLELIRGKTGRVYGSLITLLCVMKGLPLSYNRDIQEDKEPLFDAVKNIQGALKMMTQLTEAVRFNDEKMGGAAREGLLLATDLADYLVTKGLPFRQAHKVIGKIVSHSLQERSPFETWKLDAFQAFSPLFDSDLYDRLSIGGAIDKKGGIGGTSRDSIKTQIHEIKTRWTDQETSTK